MTYWILLSLLPFEPGRRLAAILMVGVSFGIPYITYTPALTALAAAGAVLLVGKAGQLFGLGAPEPWKIPEWPRDRVLSLRPLPREMRNRKATGRRFIPGEQPGRRNIPPL